MPEPESEIESGEFVAVLTTDTLPDALAARVGANTTLKLTVCFADNVTGRAKPLTLNPVPVALILETVTFELPVLVRVTPRMLLVVSVARPRFKAVALAESCRIRATPLPLSAILVGEFEALLTRAKLLVRLPLDVGVKLSVNGADFPGASVSGKVSPVTRKPAPGPAVCATLRVALPVLLTVTVWVLV